MTKHDFEKGIRQTLEHFKQGYKNRDLKVVDEYIDNLFEKSEKTAILGTSLGEWMKGIEGAKELVQSDWEYWGDVDMDTANANISIFEDTAFISLKATVRYEFEYTEEKYESYLNFVKRFLNPENEQYQMSSKTKAGVMGFILTHFNQDREKGKRESFYPLRINAVMTIQNEKAVFRFMEFSMDFYGKYPELRIDNQMMNIKEYYKQQNGMVEACLAEDREEVRDVIEKFRTFIEDGFNGSREKHELVEHLYSIQVPYIVDAAGRQYLGGEEAANYIIKQRLLWSTLAVDYKAVFADVSKDTAWVTCNALASSHIGSDTGADILMAHIENVVGGKLSSKDKLFAVQKEVANYFLQYSKGEYFLWPVRLAAMLVKEENQWKVYNMSISYPFYYILEGKYIGGDMI